MNHAIARHVSGLFLTAAVFVAGCASSATPAVDAGSDARDCSDPRENCPTTQRCVCCRGVTVEWPANEDCGGGACDGYPAYCNVAQTDGGADAGADGSEQTSDAALRDGSDDR